MSCAECGSQFDLTSVPYYDNKCPDCIDPVRLQPRCFRCSDRIPEDELESIGLVNKSGRHAGRKDYVPMHRECKRAHLEEQAPAP